MIPQTIHQIWIGPKKEPIEWIETWAEKNPHMDHIVWSHNMIKWFGLKSDDKYQQLFEKEDYAGASDIARVEILEKLGGVYIDADAVCLESIENEEFMDGDFFAVSEYDDRVANGVIGCVPFHEIMVDYANRISRTTILEPACYTIGGTMLTTCIDVYGRDKVTILPSDTFYPKWKHRGTIKEKIYSRHMWGSTKSLYK